MADCRLITHTNDGGQRNLTERAALPSSNESCIPSLMLWLSLKMIVLILGATLFEHFPSFVHKLLPAQNDHVLI